MILQVCHLVAKIVFEDSNATELQDFLCTFANGFLIRFVV